jgi:tetratricopeptide (TPR) repeat protein
LAVAAAAAAISLSAIAAYSRTFSVPFVFDDIDAIANNPTIRHWSTALFPPANATVSGRPVLNLSFAANYAIGGADVVGYHVVNLAIHVLAGLVLFGILRRTLVWLAGPTSDLAAFSAALLWTLHPLQTESVTYVVQRAESLMGLFYLLTLYAFIRGAGADPGRRGRWFALSWLACLLGMATKEVMVSAPVMALLYDRTFLSGSFREAWRRHRTAYLGLAATWIILPILVLSTHGRAGTSGFESGVSFWSYVLTQFPAIFRYLKLSAWPRPLVFDYGTQWVGIGEAWPTAIVVLGLAAAAAWALFRTGAKARALGFAGAWFFAILAPTSLVPGNRQTAAEHRMYLALIPIAAVAAVAIHRRLGRAALPVALALAAALGSLTLARNLDYRSALVLWTDTVSKCPENAFARNNLGFELAKEPGRSPEAVEEFEEAIRLKPDLAPAHNNLGHELERTPGRLRDAIEQYGRAIRLEPGLADAHYNLGNALSDEGRTGEAIQAYREALRLKPGLAEAHDNLGAALASEGRIPEAVAEFEEAIRLNPGLAEAHNNLGNALGSEGRTAEAIEQFEQALRIEPGFAEAHNNLGNLLNVAGRTEEAIVHYQAALSSKPGDIGARYNLAIALLKTPGRTADAEAQLREILRIDPGNGPAGELLARIQAANP